MQFVSFVVILFLVTQTRTEEKHDRFEWELVRTVLDDKCFDCNVILSPFPIKLLLSLLNEGIEQNSHSKKELSRLFSQLRGNEIDKYFQDTIRKLNEDGKVSIASQICLSNSVSIERNYEQKAQNTYDTSIQKLNLNNFADSVKIVNGFVSNKTKGKIRNFIESENLRGMSALFLNAMYFEDKWYNTFDKRLTTYKNFFTPCNTIKVPMLHRNETEYSFKNSKKLNSKIVRLFYEDGTYSMYIILPNEIDGLESVIEKLDAKVIREETCHMESALLTLEIPKFKFDSSLNLKNNLETLGIKQIFTSNAGISSLTSTNALFVSDVVQKSGIVVNEAGTVAYTAAQANIQSRMYSKRDVFIADHPFLFFIKHEETGAIIFAGKVLKPSF